jgi:hypothetical protein
MNSELKIENQLIDAAGVTTVSVPVADYCCNCLSLSLYPELKMPEVVLEIHDIFFDTF